MMRKSKNAPKYPNLAAEMSRENVSISDICKVTGKGKSTIYLYMNGTGAGDFTINDASNLWQMHRSGSIGKPAGYDRVAFMDIYKPLYERERQRMQLAPATRQRIDAATASLSGEGRKMLEDAKQDRKKQDDFFRMIESGLQHQALTTDNSPELLESKEEVQ